MASQNSANQPMPAPGSDQEVYDEVLNRLQPVQDKIDEALHMALGLLNLDKLENSPENDSTLVAIRDQVEEVYQKLSLLGSESEYSFAAVAKLLRDSRTKSDQRIKEDVPEEKKPLPLKPLLNFVMSSFELLSKDQKKEFVASLLKEI